MEDSSAHAATATGAARRGAPIALVPATLGLVLCLGLVTGCSTTLRVSLDEEADFRAFRTWAWAAADERERHDDPLTAEEQSLARDVTAAIRRGLAERGLEYAASADPDLLVVPELSVRRREVHRERGDAMEYLPSFHASPSYWIEREIPEAPRIVEDAALGLRVIERESGRTLWRARLWSTFDGRFAPHVDATVASLMASLPAASTGGGDDAGSRAIARAGRPAPTP